MRARSLPPGIAAVVVAAGASVVACTPAVVHVTQSPSPGHSPTGSRTPSQASTQVITRIEYAPAEPPGSQGHLLDLYLPEGSEPRPLVIWTSGSAWMADSGRSGASAFPATLNHAGYAVAGVSVRSSSQATFPAQVHDIKAAIRFLRAHADQYHLDPDRFAIMGDSSGGWVASMATLAGGVPALEGTVGTTGNSSRVQAGVAFYGPTDFLRMNAQRPGGAGFDHDGADSPESRLMGCPIQTCADQVRRANPITYIDANAPPMMLLHGQADPLVPHGQSVLLYEALRDAGCDVRFFSVPGAGHGVADVMASLRFGTQTVYTGTQRREQVNTGSPDPTWATIIGWLNEVLGKPAATG